MSHFKGEGRDAGEERFPNRSGEAGDKSRGEQRGEDEGGEVEIHVENGSAGEGGVPEEVFSDAEEKIDEEEGEDCLASHTDGGPTVLTGESINQIIHFPGSAAEEFILDTESFVSEGVERAGSCGISREVGILHIACDENLCLPKIGVVETE